MPVIVVEPLRWSRSPIYIFFLCLIAITGIITIAGLSDNMITKEMGKPYYHFWGGFLLVGSIVSVAGSYWKDKINGMLIERSGIFLLGGASLIWGVLVILLVGLLRSPFTLVSTFTFALTCFLQVRYINKHITLITEAITESRKKSG